MVDNHAAITANLEASWTTGVDATPVAYSKILSTAGDADNTIFTSSNAGLQQVIEGMADIANEVGSSKIQGPVTDQNPNKVESQYSWNSLADFENNIRSIQNVYYGSLDGTTVEATSISAMTKAVNPDLDTKITAQIKDVIAAIGEIPEPFRDSITNTAAQPQIADAVQKAADLNQMLSVDLKKALLGI